MLSQLEIIAIAEGFLLAARSGQLSQVIDVIRNDIARDDSDVKEAIIVSDKLKELQDLLVWEHEKASILLYNEFLQQGLPD